MKIVKIIGILLLVYVAIVAIFESLLGYYQPVNDGTLVITTTAADGSQSDRVLASIQHNDTLYVAANHWPRAWYSTALENPQVSVTFNEVKTDYTAVPVTGAEHEEVDSAKPLPTFFRILTGFPPRYFLRLDPR